MYNYTAAFNNEEERGGETSNDEYVIVPSVQIEIGSFFSVIFIAFLWGDVPSLLQTWQLSFKLCEVEKDASSSTRRFAWPANL